MCTQQWANDPHTTYHTASEVRTSAHRSASTPKPHTLQPTHRHKRTSQVQISQALAACHRLGHSCGIHSADAVVCAQHTGPPRIAQLQNNPPHSTPCQRNCYRPALCPDTQASVTQHQQPPAKFKLVNCLQLVSASTKTVPSTALKPFPDGAKANPPAWATSHSIKACTPHNVRLKHCSAVITKE